MKKLLIAMIVAQGFSPAGAGLPSFGEPGISPDAATIAFMHQAFLLEPVGYWRGAVGFLLFAIALRMMNTRA